MARKIYGVIILTLVIGINTVLARTTSSPLSSQPTETNLSRCPDVICSLEFIPAECLSMPVLTRDGRNCYGCPEWSATCKRELARQEAEVTTAAHEVITCPKTPCPVLEGVPKDCVFTETYFYHGLKCDKCPTIRATCAQGNKTVLVSAPDSKCPLLDCTLEFIPDECREIPKTEINGVMCDGCPKKKASCIPQSSIQPESIPRRPCGLIHCPGFIPQECSVERKYTNRWGEECALCPQWREGCREEERQVHLTLPEGAVPSQCPQTNCTEQIPQACQETLPYKFFHLDCFRCPKWRTGCSFKKVVKVATSSTPAITDEYIPKVACPLIHCEVPMRLSPNCYQKKIYTFMGQQCEDCPLVKTECADLVPPRPVVSVNASRLDSSDPSCPLSACPMIYIHPACREETQYLHQNRWCDGCPKQRPNCVPPTEPSVQSLQTQSPVLENICPVKACTLMLIPPECIDEQPYDFNGRTCFNCPKWRVGCNSGSDSPMTNTVPEMACPLFACPRILIPQECREEQSFKFRNKTCYKCPKWREGCVPSTSLPHIVDTPPAPVPETSCPVLKCEPSNVPSECMENRTRAYKGLVCEDCPVVKPDCPTTSTSATPEPCPPIPCPATEIPEECKQEHTYQYKGQTCFLCPRWRPGCTPINSPSPFDPVNQQSITKLKGVFPVNEFMSSVDALSCPPLPCPDILIPPPCKEESFYMHQGFRCRGCPRWRLGCQPSSGAPVKLNANGILSFSLFNDLFDLGR
ncbi:uncharacterized protein LOC127871475 isoform X2 [Dreissena polymorpha]|uniref:Uncharacterized protein n=1 Tax=Dreissena polymorpha TaxID=45954 RepID=A0A9D4R7A2_DREPO|nr:uncharacterized protein LOC127871475 isoform X2 [Dreissena polymorpha]KAH3857701.1 hypothetical protein DPMN_100313 [Dreissena polymorpha]